MYTSWCTRSLPYAGPKEFRERSHTSVFAGWFDQIRVLQPRCPGAEHPESENLPQLPPRLSDPSCDISHILTRKTSGCRRQDLTQRLTALSHRWIPVGLDIGNRAARAPDAIERTPVGSSLSLIPDKPNLFRGDCQAAAGKPSDPGPRDCLDPRAAIRASNKRDAANRDWSTSLAPSKKF